MAKAAAVSLERRQAVWQRAAAAAAVARLRRTDPAVAKLVSLVASAYGVEPTELLRRTRCAPNIAFARQLAMYLTNVKLGRNMKEIGHLFGRDRTTVSYACALMEDRREGEFEIRVDALEAAIDATLAAANDVSREARHAVG